MVQWFHLYEVDDETFRLVVRTFRSVFPQVTVWQSMATDVLLVGSSELLGLDEEMLAAKLKIGKQPARFRAASRSVGRLDVQVLDLERVFLDEPAPRFDLVPH